MHAGRTVADLGRLQNILSSPFGSGRSRRRPQTTPPPVSKTFDQISFVHQIKGFIVLRFHPLYHHLIDLV